MMSLRRNALVLVLAAGCEGAVPSVTPPALREEPRAARWVRTSPARGPLPWEAPAVVRSDGAGIAELTASVRVRVVRVLAQPGDRVAQGQRLAEVEAPEVLRAIASRAAATARVVPLRAWRDELASQRDAGMVRVSELREVQVRLADAESERLRADADLRASGLPAAELAALARTGRASLRAPLAGVLRSVSMVPGRVVEPGAAPLAVIVAPRPVRVEVRLHDAWPEGAALRFEPAHGEPVDLDPAPVSEVVDPESGARVLWLRATLDAPMLAGAPGRVVLRGVPADAAAVPARALLRSNGDAVLYVRDGETARARRVTVLSVTGGVAVVRGVAAGTEVLAEPTRTGVQ